MTKSAKSKLIKANTICWLGSLILPLIFHFGFASTKFPWPVLLPVAFLPLMLASNGLLSKAAGDASTDSTSK
ncbi:MAG: hypothetical protein ABMA13_10150 [Chthoniobacteraceae bacterium]